MKLNASQSDNFIKSPNKDIQFSLIFGVDEGLVRQRVKSLCNFITDNQDDPFCKLDISFDKLKEDFVLLSDEIAAISMYGGRKFIHIYNVPQSIPKEIKEIIKNPIGDAFVVFSGGELSTRSSFRKFFETEKNIVSIACYPPENYNLSRIIKGIIESNNYRYDSETIRMLENIFSGSDSMVIQNELDKIMLYKYDEKEITPQDIIECCNNELDGSLDKLSNAIANKQTIIVNRIFDSIINESKFPAISALRIVKDYFSKIYLVRYKMDNGIPIEKAVSELRPPIFYKNKASFINNVHNWNIKRTSNLIAKLQKAEIECKRTSAPVNTICRQLFTILSA